MLQSSGWYFPSTKTLPGCFKAWKLLELISGTLDRGRRYGSSILEITNLPPGLQSACHEVSNLNKG